MAQPVDVLTSTGTSLVVGGVHQVIRNMTKDQEGIGQFTDLLVAGGVGIAGFLGATQPVGRGVGVRNTVENISIGAVNGAAAYAGVRMVEFLGIASNSANGNGNGTQRRIEAPKKVVNYPTQNRRKSMVEI